MTVGIWPGLVYCSPVLSGRFNVGIVEGAKESTGESGISSSGIGVRTPSFGMVTDGEDMLRKLKIQL